MTHPLGKGIFIWQQGTYYMLDVKTEAAKIKAAGFKWAAVQTCDGYMTQWPLTVVGLVDALIMAGIDVWSWGMIYANGPTAEGWGYSAGGIAGHHRRTLALKGHIFDPEAWSKRPRGGVGVEWAYKGMDEEDTQTPFGMTSYRYPDLHRTFPWKEALRGVDFVMPQVYWERAHNPYSQLDRCFDQYRKLTQVPIIPIGAAYGVTGWEPTVSDLRSFEDGVVALNLPGYSFWNWRTLSRRPALLRAVTEME
jgi:hypothetical protein